MATVEFSSVFEAMRGIGLLNLLRSDNNHLDRDHNYGSLKFKVTQLEKRILKQNGIDFQEVKEND